MVPNKTVEQHETAPDPSRKAVKRGTDLKADVSSKGSMEIGTSITIPILARKEWNNTQIRLVAGEEYHLKRVGNG